MTFDKLKDLVIMSSEKAVLDSVSLSAVVDRFAASDRGLPL
jgi:hypothetical protein